MLTVKKIVYIIVLLLIPSLANAGSCAGGSCTIDCTSTNIATAYGELPAGGGTITCNAGTVAFNGSVTIAKSVKITGNESDPTLTTITFTATLGLNSSSSKNIEISGLTLDMQRSGEVPSIENWGDGGNGHIYIHHNIVKNLHAGSGFFVTPASHTLFASNTWGSDAARIADQPIVIQNVDSNQSMGAVSILKRDFGFGLDFSSSVDWVIFESNTFWSIAGNTVAPGPAIFDIRNGGKVLFRFNTLHDSTLVGHGACEDQPGEVCGIAFEAYNNLIIWHDGTYHGAPYILQTMWSEFIHHNRFELRGTAATLWTANSNVVYQMNAQRDGTDTDCGWNMKPLISRGNTTQLCSASTNAGSGPCTGTAGGCLYFCSLDTDPATGVTSDRCAATSHGTCSKFFCSNSWTVCSVDGDCSGGGTCNRFLDNGAGTRWFGTWGAGKLNSDGTIDSEPVHGWANYVFKCAADGTGCDAGTLRNPGTPYIPGDGASLYVATGTQILQAAPTTGQPRFPYDTLGCPHTLVGTGTCNSTGYGTAAYGLSPPTQVAITVIQPATGHCVISPASEVVASGATVSPTVSCPANGAWRFISFGGTCGCTGTACSPFVASVDCSISGTEQVQYYPPVTRIP
jgi:hypothetical protein